MASSVNKVVESVRKSLAMGPSVRNLISQYQLEPSKIVSTGPHQTLLKSDVLNYITKRNLEPKLESSTNQQQAKSQAVAVPNTNSTTRMASFPISDSQANTRLNIKGTITRISNESRLKSKYARKYPTQHEIDVINNGGCI